MLSHLGSEQEQLQIDGMEGFRSAGARLASVRMDKQGAFEWKKSLPLASTLRSRVSDSCDDAAGNVIVRRQLRRQQMLKFIEPEGTQVADQVAAYLLAEELASSAR